jgi:hypothetical protein
VTTEPAFAPAQQLAGRPGPDGRSIAFHLWHLARRADQLAARVPRMTPVLGVRLGETREIWAAEHLAARWCVTGPEPGDHRTGVPRADAAAARIGPPGPDALLGYARRAFAAAERALAAVDDGLLGERDRTDPSPTATVGDALLAHLTHHNRHLGEIACLRGLQGLRGSVAG